MTFSIVAYDPKNNEWGVGVQSKFIAVGSIVPFAKSNVGAIASQAYANTSYGPRGLNLLEQDFAAEEVIKILTDHDSGKEHRQVGIVDKNGNAASFTGKECFDWAGHYVGKNFCCQGNILDSEQVVKDMSKTFEQTEGDLIDRILAALEAAQAAGGDRRGKQSAAILIVKESGAYDGGTDKYIDIRVDDHETPIKELKRVFQLYDLSLLKRDDPEDKFKIEGEVLENIVSILRKEDFYTGEKKNVYDEELKQAFKKWLHTNNFEVKERDDNYIWGSVYRYILEHLD